MYIKLVPNTVQETGAKADTYCTGYTESKNFQSRHYGGDKHCSKMPQKQTQKHYNLRIFPQLLNQPPNHKIVGFPWFGEPWIGISSDCHYVERETNNCKCKHVQSNNSA